MNLRTQRRVKIIFVSFLLILSTIMIYQLPIFPKLGGIDFTSPITSQICNNLERNDDCLPMFRNFDNKYRVSPLHNLLYCAIEKNLSTLFAAIICLLYDKKKFLSSGLSVAENLYEERLCKGKNEYKNIGDVGNLYNLAKFHFILIARDPIQRFVSGFVDKCIMETRRDKYAKNKCYGCFSNVSCVIEKLAIRAKYFSVKGGAFSYEDIHFFPQNWHCNLRQNLQRYHVIQYVEDESSLIQEIIKIFEKIGVDMDIINKIMYDLHNKKTPHATRGNPIRAQILNEIYSNKVLLKKVVSLFYYDYLLFGFKIPAI
uniref:Sulfotransfer_1 domain-containing protein n=1 Tax=Parastrongyloides trichosuri TaxID=131310 RepID=A0A0N5A461_PARTI